MIFSRSRSDGHEDVGGQAERRSGRGRRTGQVAGRGARQRLVAELDRLRGGNGDDPVLERVRRVRRLGLDVEIAVEAELRGQPVGLDQRRAPHRQARARAVPRAGSRRSATASAARPRRARARPARTRPSPPRAGRSSGHTQTALRAGRWPRSPCRRDGLPSWSIPYVRAGAAWDAGRSTSSGISRSRRIWHLSRAGLAGMVAEASQGRSLRLSGCDAGDRPGGYANCSLMVDARPPPDGNREPDGRSRPRTAVWWDMIPNSHMYHQDWRDRADRAPSAGAPCRPHSARAGRAAAARARGRPRHERRSRLAMLLRGRPAMI